MMRFRCPNDGPFDAEPETRTTTPAKVKSNPVPRRGEHEPRDAATPGPELSPTHDFVTGERRQLVSIAAGDPVEVTVGVCPKCGSPIVAPPEKG